MRGHFLLVMMEFNMPFEFFDNGFDPSEDLLRCLGSEGAEYK
jgi:hypothetical protein